MTEIVDAIAIAIRTGKAKVGSSTGVEHEGLVRVRRRLIREELQTHSDLRGLWTHLAKEWRRSAPFAQSLRTILKSRQAFLSRKA